MPSKIEIKTLRDLVEYHPETGEMYWKERGREYFTHDRFHKAWNARNAGRRAFVTYDSHGYCQGGLFAKLYLAHRVAFALHYGRWPKKSIDHINRIKTDNRIKNLREIDHAENLRNVGIQKGNTSGVRGVHWCKNRKRWIAQIGINNEVNYLGTFENLDGAAEARRVAEEKVGGYPKTRGQNIGGGS